MRRLRTTAEILLLAVVAALCVATYQLRQETRQLEGRNIDDAISTIQDDLQRHEEDITRLQNR